MVNNAWPINNIISICFFPATVGTAGSKEKMPELDEMMIMTFFLHFDAPDSNSLLYLCLFMRTNSSHHRQRSVLFTIVLLLVLGTGNTRCVCVHAHLIKCASVRLALGWLLFWFCNGSGGHAINNRRWMRGLMSY